jgi:hypothetical protein
MLIEAIESTPPTPQLSGLTSQSMVSSSPSPQISYDVIERLKGRVTIYRNHHNISYQKNQNTIEAQNIKMKAETHRLQQQFLNNANNNNNTNTKSKQQKSVNTTSGASRTGNKRSNSSTNSCNNNSNNNNNNNNNNASNNTNTNNNCDANEPKANKLPKLAAAVTARTNANSNAVKVSDLSPSSSYPNNTNKFNTNSPSNQIDIKMKSSISTCISTTISQPLMPNNTVISSAPEIKREVIDNSYFEGVTVDAIRDFLASTNNNNSAPNGIEMFGSDICNFFNDGSFADDGLAGANFGDEDFITKFLEEINGPAFNDNGQSFQSQQMITGNTQLKHQPVITHSNNMAVNSNNNNNNINNNNNTNANNNNNNNNNNMIGNSSQLNSVNFNRNQFQSINNEITSYHPIQPRLQPNSMTNIPNRSSAQILNSNSHSNFAPTVVTVNNNNNNNNNIRNYNPNAVQQPQPQQLLLQQTTALLPQQHSLNNAGLQQQPQPSHLILQQQPSQPVHLRLSTAAVSGMGVVSVIPKTENNLSVQLSIQVPQTQQQSQHQTSQVPQSTQPSQQSANASIKLKQMAQQVQQKTHQWVMNHSNIPLTQNALQSQQIQVQQQQQQQQQTQQQQQRLAQQPQRLLPQQQIRTQPIPQQQQQPNQLQLQQQQTQQHYFNPQMSQQVYWQQQQQQQQTQPQQQQSQPVLQQNQQHFQNYWSHHPHGQVMSQPSQQQQQQQQQAPQQPQNYYNNSYNSNYF